MFIHTCGFISSISDLLNFREALGERDLVIPVKSESTATPPESKRHSTMDYSTKVSQFQQVAEEIVLSQWPSLKPLQKTMENKARWLKIGSSLDSRVETGVWGGIAMFEKHDALQEMTGLNTQHCREIYALICESMSCLSSEFSPDRTVKQVTAKFLHPVLGQWIFFEFMFEDSQNGPGAKFSFDFPAPLCPESGEKVEFFSVGFPTKNDTRILWEYLTSTSAEGITLCETDRDAGVGKRNAVDVSPEGSEDLSCFWRPLLSPFQRFSLLAREMQSREQGIPVMNRTATRR